MESLEQKKRRLIGKQYLSKYINVLNRLTCVEVDVKQILSLEETDKVINMASDNRVFSERILFENKSRLAQILGKLPSSDLFYIFISRTNLCGALRINSINDFNYMFDFSDEESGIISLISEKCNIKILLDFYEDIDRYLDIEIYADSSLNNC